MHYPVWYLPELGGGTLIALIAIIHVFISHFAVGGGLYLVMAEKKGLAEHSQPILDFTRRHARFFLLITMVVGSITGVGIWFIIALVNPAATSYLIHNFVWGWAAEWVFFTVEIAAAFVYFYMFGRMDWSTHLRVGYLYFFAAWMSLFLINGIIGAMLTPGGWAETGNFWQGFFNPSFWPSLLFRTALAILLAGCYGCLSAAREKEEEVRVKMTRFSGSWSLVALVVAVPAAIWYGAALGSDAQQLLQGKSPTIRMALEYGLGGLLVLLVLTLLVTVLRPGWNTRPVAVVTMLAAFVLLGSFEWIREAARRPYVVGGVIYSNSIFVRDMDRLSRDGFLSSALWAEHDRVTPDNRLAAGRELYMHQCYSCHTLGGCNNDLAAQTANMSYPGLIAYLGKMHTLRPFMPPFAGTETEARALAAFLVGEVHGKEVVDAVPLTGTPLGSTLFEEHCGACHAIDEVAPAFAGVTVGDAAQMLATLNEISEEMEPFGGSDEERMALAAWLVAPDAAVPVTESAMLDGEVVFAAHCGACHAVADIATTVNGWERQEIYTNLGRLPELVPDMPPFAGTELEREALTVYLDQQKGGN